LLRVGGTRLLAGYSGDGVHVVVPHVGTVGRDVFRIERKREFFHVSDGDPAQRHAKQRKPKDKLVRFHLRDFLGETAVVLDVKTALVQTLQRLAHVGWLVKHSDHDCLLFLFVLFCVLFCFISLVVQRSWWQP